MRIIKFRAWGTFGKNMNYQIQGEDLWCFLRRVSGMELMQYTGLKDKNGVEIYEGDILRFSDKWEWYKLEWTWKLMGVKGEQKEKLIEEYNLLPYEEREIEGIEDYEWLLSGEIQQYWEVIGNIYENKK